MRALPAFSNFALAGCLMTVSAANLTLTGDAVTAARDNSNNPIPVGALVLYLVDTTLGDNFNSLLTQNVFDLTLGDTLAVGQAFGGYEIVGYDDPVTGGVIGSGQTIAFDTAGSNVSSGDRFAIAWFDGLSYDDQAQQTQLVESFFGIVTDGSWVIPSNTATLEFQSSPSGQSEIQQITATETAFKEINEIPEPAMLPGLFGLACLLIVRRFQQI